MLFFLIFYLFLLLRERTLLLLPPSNWRLEIYLRRNYIFFLQGFNYFQKKKMSSSCMYNNRRERERKRVLGLTLIHIFFHILKKNNFFFIFLYFFRMPQFVLNFIWNVKRIRINLIVAWKINSGILNMQHRKHLPHLAKIYTNILKLL